MTYKTYNCNSYTIHTIKTDKFKTCHMEILFRKPVVKEDLPKDTLMVDVLTETTKKYPTRRALASRLEELYKASFWGLATKIGNVLNTNFVIDFVAPEFISEENYLEEVLSFPFEAILNPNVINDEFATLPFKLCQKRTIIDAKSIDEDAFRLSISKTLQALGDTPSAYKMTGTVEELENITPGILYDHYKKLLKDNTCDIFLIGNLDMDKAVEIIKKAFVKRVITKVNLEMHVKNALKKRVTNVNEKSKFIQTNLNILYNVTDLSDYESNIVFNIYNYILGSGGITSKLYQEIREKNSYCYAINSMYLKYDGLLMIHVSLDEKNRANTIKLIKKVMKDMAAGKFTEDDIADAKKNYELALSLTLDNQVAILNNYVFKVFDNLPDLEERIALIRKVSYDEVVKVANKLKMNTIFALEGESGE